jgi:Kef-type K+ transport system membrane component KefB
VPPAIARRGLLAAFVLCGGASIAFAAEQNLSGKSEAIFIAELGLLLLVGRGLGELMQRVGQPAVMGQLLGGLLLGPSLLGLVWPDFQHALFPQTAEQKSMVDAVSQLGVLMLLLLTGMETDLRLVRRVGRAAIAVAAAGVMLPFVCGFGLGEMLPDSILPNPQARFFTALFLATALSISSIKIVAMVVREMNFMRRDIGQIIVASAILEDSSGWIIIAISFGIASSGTLDLRSVSFAIVGTLLFLAVSMTVGRRVVFGLIRWTNDHFASEFAVITMILLIMFTMALITYLIGVQTVLGAFVAGVLIGESPILTRHIDEQLRGLIAALFMPVFFGLSGLSADLTILKRSQFAVACRWAHRHCQRRQVCRRFRRRQARRSQSRRIARARLRHERARLDRGDRRLDRPVGGRVQPQPVHADRGHGGAHHHDDAADAALGAAPAAAARGGTPAARARGA